jgi:hypothetical protein
VADGRAVRELRLTLVGLARLQVGRDGNDGKNPFTSSERGDEAFTERVQRHATEVFSFDGAIPKDGYEKSEHIHDEQAGDEGAIVRVDLLFHMLPAGEKDEEVDALEQSDEDGESGCVS